MPESYIQAWEDELPEHPIVAELRAQPGRWGIITMDTYIALRSGRRHPNVEVRGPLHQEGQPLKARWLPDPVVAAMQVLKGGGYGG